MKAISKDAKKIGIEIIKKAIDIGLNNFYIKYKNNWIYFKFSYKELLFLYLTICGYDPSICFYTVNDGEKLLDSGKAGCSIDEIFVHFKNKLEPLA